MWMGIRSAVGKVFVSLETAECMEQLEQLTVAAVAQARGVRGGGVVDRALGV